MRPLFTGILLTTVIAIGCAREPEARTYQLTGQVLVVRPETSEILVAHEDIPGFMPAMTMPYRVKDEALLKDRQPGDLIIATLVVEPEVAFLSSITKTDSAPLPPDARTTIPAAAGIELLRPGDIVSFATGGGSRVSHVGVYIGDNKFIHSSSSRGVRIDTLTGYYAKRFVNARRPVANVEHVSIYKLAPKRAT